MRLTKNVRGRIQNLDWFVSDISVRLRIKGDKVTRSKDHGSVQSLLRALHLLEVIAGEADGLRLVEIAERSGYPTSTVHRLLTTLEERQFVFCDKTTKNWNIGSHCFAVGAGFGRRRNLGAIAQPVMQRLRARCNLTVNLAVAEANKMMLICQFPGKNIPPGLARPGAQSPITATALGQSVIASLPEAEINQILNSAGDRQPARKNLSESISETRQRHFAVDNEVNAVGLRCVAAPIFDEYGNPIAALSIAGGVPQIDVGSFGAIGSDVRMAAAEVTQNIGGCAPAFPQRRAS
jgi:IclR family acetate operon transcriptional repressor